MEGNEDAGGSTGNNRLTSSAKSGWSWAVSQRLIPTGKQSGLRTRIAATESVSLCTLMKS